MRGLLIAMGLLCGMAWGQGATPAVAAAPLPVFETVSIHENRTSGNSSMVQPTDTGLSATNVNVRILLRYAYETQQMTDDQIIGLPAWALKTRFNIEARVEDADSARLKALSHAERREMLRQMLVDRFKLVAHRETKEGAVYALVVDKKGSKVEATKVYAAGVEHEAGHLMMNTGSIDAVNSNMRGLASMLTREVGRPVYDKTGLAGQYDFKLAWTPDKAEGTGVDAPPPLFTALQEQLGLRLEATRGAVETLVVERVEMPSAN